MIMRDRRRETDSRYGMITRDRRRDTERQREREIAVIIIRNRRGKTRQTRAVRDR